MSQTKFESDSLAVVAVIDDDADTRALHCMALEMENYHCIEFCDGNAFLAFLKTNPPPQLLLCDLFMPNMSGIELVNHLASVPDYSNIRIVLISGALHAAQLPEHLYKTMLRKPISVDALINTVRDQLDLPVIKK